MRRLILSMMFVVSCRSGPGVGPTRDGPLVTFTGNVHVREQDLRAVMCLDKASTQACAIGTDALVSHDVAQLDKLLYDDGYLFHTLATQVEPSDGGTPREVAIQIDEGPLVLFGTVTTLEHRLNRVEVALGASDGGLPLLRSKERGVFSRTGLAYDIDTLTAWYRDAGYSEADVTPHLSPHRETSTVDLAFEITHVW